MSLQKKKIALTLVTMSCFCLVGLTANAYAHDQILSAINKLQPTIQYKQAKNLAIALQKVTTTGCTIPWQIMLSIAFHESSLRKDAVNMKSMDFGLMQISKATIARLKLNKALLLTSEEYALKTACTILMYNRANYSSKVRHWIGIYRSGIALHNSRINENALAYDRIIRNTAYSIGFRNRHIELVNNNYENNNQ